MAKDPLCPLGFHPQVRWPSRCKRCFRDYKEHTVKKEDLTATTDSTTALLSSSTLFLDTSTRSSSRYNLNPSTLTYSSSPSSSEETSSGSRASSTSSSSSTSGVGSASDAYKDFSTPYSSISSEARNRLSRFRDESTSNRPTSAMDSLSLPSENPVLRRRKTTDLTDVDLEPGSSSSGSPSPYSSEAATETVTFKLLKKANSFGGGTDSTSEESNGSASPSPSPPARSKTPSFREKSKERSPMPPSPKVKPKLTFATTSDEDLPSKLASSLKKTLKKDTGEPTTTTGAATEEAPSKPKKTKKKRLLIQEVKEVTPAQQESTEDTDTEAENSADVAFIIQVKSSGRKKTSGEDDDDMMSMTTATETTETTLVDLMENTVAGMSSWEVEDMKKEVDRLKEKCDKLEKEKADILARRVASLDAPRPQSSEYLRLQQKVNQLTSTNEDLKDEQRHLESRVKELEAELSTRPNPDIFKRQIADLRSKLTGAESQLDQLQEAKREAIQQMKDMHEEFEEMQDSFREEQAEEFANLKKELDDASKNCRLLQFKLRKVEKRADQLEAEKKELEQRLESIQDSGRIKKLEEELVKARNEMDKLKSASKDSTLGLGLKKKAPLVKSLSKEKDTSMPPDFDPHKTLRDLQSALERESDLREQLRFAEEESTSLRQKISRIENENDTLLIQIKKMSSKSRPDVNKAKGVETGKLGDRPKENDKDKGDKLDVDDLKLQLELNEQESKVLQKKVEELEKSNAKLSKDLQKAEDKAQSLEKAAPNITKFKNLDEVTALRRKLIEKEREVERLQTEVAASPKGSKAKPSFSRTKSLEQEPTKNELEAKAELKKIQQELTKLKTETDAEKRVLEDELARARQDVENHQSRILQIGESNKNLMTEVGALKSSLNSMKDQYENIQDDMVLKNSKLTGQNETLESEMRKWRKEHDTIDKELRALRETFNSRQDTWIKEKLTLQEKLAEAEKNSKKLLSSPGDRESTKLKNLLNESTKDLETKTKEVDSYKEQVLSMQRENDELRRKLEDFDKVSQVHLRSLAPEPSQKSDKEIKDLKEKLTAEEKVHRNEMAQTKMRHDQELAAKVEEITSVQQQLSRAKRERDTFRQMVDSAQRAIAELKSRGTGSRGSISGLEEAATGAHAAVGALQERITSLEDDLAEARRDTARQKTELVTEKSTWEMKMAELQQKINELEEERLLSGAGRVRGSSMIGRTKLELAWQKEREEQQRRLKEATTLARDLKTTLLEIEREKDREKVEAKRRFEQLKTSLEEEQQEMRRKVDSAQNDLLELRDAHAKLRTANEKLRKDRERLENQRESQIKKELELKKVRSEKDKMLDQIISKLAALNPTASNSNLSQLPPKLNAAEILHYLQNLQAIEDPEDLLSPKEKKRGHFKRAASVGDTDGPELPRSRESLASMPASYGMKGYPSTKQYYGSASSSTLTLPSRGGGSGSSSRGPSSSSSGTKKISSNMSDGGGVSSHFSPQGKLSRKAVSLDQDVSMPDEKKIWKGGSEAGSGSSLVSYDGQYSRGSSMERVSTLEKSKPSSFVGKMKNFVKSKSIEETPAAEKLMIGSAQALNAGSDLSLNSDIDGKEKRGIKDKMKGMFKRSTRSPSVERKPPGNTMPSSLQLQKAPDRPSRENTPKREMTPSQQRPLQPSQQRPLAPTSTINLYR